MEDVAARVLNGDRRAAGRLLRWIDDGASRADDVFETLHQQSGKAFFLGVTGNPGSGKSTIVDQLIRRFRTAGKRVACIAVDPTSPFSGGAILGDRVRMGIHGTDEGVFIRSVATRGNLGGISRSTPSMMTVMDAMGFDIVIVETVGVGQSEVDIAGICDLNVVLVVPGLGDEVQAAKAGLFEIADLFVVNKAERDGADRLVRELKTMISFGAVDIPVLKTSANTGAGIDALFEILLEQSETERSDQIRRKRAESMIRLIASADFRKDLNARIEEAPDLVQDVVDKKCSPLAAVRSLFHET